MICFSIWSGHMMNKIHMHHSISCYYKEKLMSICPFMGILPQIYVFPFVIFSHKIWKSGFSTYSLNFYSIIHATYHWNFCVWISDGNIHEKGVMAKFLYFNWNKLSKEAALKLQSMKSYLSVFFFAITWYITSHHFFS